MRTGFFINRIRAAHALTIAMSDGAKPDQRYLEALGLPAEIAKRFKRS